MKLSHELHLECTIFPFLLHESIYFALEKKSTKQLRVVSLIFEKHGYVINSVHSEGYT